MTEKKKTLTVPHTKTHLQRHLLWAAAAAHCQGLSVNSRSVQLLPATQPICSLKAPCQLHQLASIKGPSPIAVSLCPCKRKKRSPAVNQSQVVLICLTNLSKVYGVSELHCHLFLCSFTNPVKPHTLRYYSNQTKLFALFFQMTRSYKSYTTTVFFNE